MRVLFLHQNAPGQFPHLAAHLAADSRNEVVFLGQTRPGRLPGVRWLQYGHKAADESAIHPYLRSTETAVRRGQAVARACLELARDGFVPDLIVAHPGWGESLFLRDVLPRAKIVSYCEMFYQTQDADIGYIPETALGLDGRCRLRIWNATLLLALEAMDAGFAGPFLSVLQPTHAGKPAGSGLAEEHHPVARIGRQMRGEVGELAGGVLVQEQHAHAAT